MDGAVVRISFGIPAVLRFPWRINSETGSYKL